MLPAMLVAFGCANEDGARAEPQAELPEGPARSAEEYLALSDDEVLFRSETIELAPNEERYICFTATTREYFQVGGYRVDAAPLRHHLVLARNLVPEDDGRNDDCEALFRITWDPLFVGASSPSGLDFPQGFAHEITRGTQLLLSLHLLNPTNEPASAHFEVRMKRIDDPRADTLSPHVFGSANFSLPPGQQSTVQQTCLVQDDIRVVGGLAHMHYMGQALRFEAGPSLDAMDLLFENERFDFDNQAIEPVDFMLHEGDIARVTCEFDNYTDEAAHFGERSEDEMCLFLAVSSGDHGFGYCGWTLDDPFARLRDQPIIDNNDGRTCEEVEPNAHGIGLRCTTDGGECPAHTTCSADLLPGDDEGVCVRLGCASDDDCGGGGATCTSPFAIEGFFLCVPEACRPPAYFIPSDALVPAIPATQPTHPAG